MNPQFTYPCSVRKWRMLGICCAHQMRTSPLKLVAARHFSAVRYSCGSTAFPGCGRELWCTVVYYSLLHTLNGCGTLWTTLHVLGNTCIYLSIVRIFALRSVVLLQKITWYALTEWHPMPYLEVQEPESQDEVPHHAVQLHLGRVPLACGLIHPKEEDKLEEWNKTWPQVIGLLNVYSLWLRRMVPHDQLLTHILWILLIASTSSNLQLALYPDCMCVCVWLSVLSIYLHISGITAIGGRGWSYLS